MSFSLDDVLRTCRHGITHTIQCNTIRKKRLVIVCVHVCVQSPGLHAAPPMEVVVEVVRGAAQTETKAKSVCVITAVVLAPPPPPAAVDKQSQVLL